MKIEVIRYDDTLWGNGQTGNRVAEALELAGAEVFSTGIYYGQHISQDFFNRDEIDAQIYIIAPDQLDVVPVKTNHKKILITFWEMPAFPNGSRPDGYGWRETLAAFDEIWVSSEFNYSTFSQFHDKVFKIRIPYRPKKYDNGNLGKIRFLTTFDYASSFERKNPSAAINAFKDAFEEGEAELVIKTKRSELFPVENESLLQMSRSDIIFISETLSNQEMIDLELSAHCLVSLHRSEGLGLHILDAVACGMPTIATAFSGNVDYMLDPRHMLVPLNQLVPPLIGYYNQFSNQGNLWAEPSRDAAAATLRYFAKNVDKCRLNAKILAEPVQKAFSPINCGNLMLEKLNG